MLIKAKRIIDRHKLAIQRQKLLKQVQELFPSELVSVLTAKERGLLKYLLAQIDVTELARIYEVPRTEILLQVIYLGHKLALYRLIENGVVIKIPTSSLNKSADYFRGIQDCKKSIMEIAQNEFRKCRKA